MFYFGYGNYEFDYYMALDIGNEWWKVKGVNKFNNEFRFTGENGGYYNPDDNTYYDKDGNPSSLDVEFPFKMYFENDVLRRKIHDHSNDDIWYSSKVESKFEE